MYLGSNHICESQISPAMAYNRSPTNYPFILSLIPSDSNSNEKTDLHLFTDASLKKKKSPQAPEEKDSFFLYLRHLKKKKKRGTESYYWHLNLQKKMAVLQPPHMEELFNLS